MDKEDPFAGVNWHDALEIGVSGSGWHGETREHPYDRFPAAMREKISPELWRLSTTSAGLHFDFRTTARQIYVRWNTEPHAGDRPAPYGGYSAPSGSSGVDCYGRDEGGPWCWVGCQEAWEAPNCNGRVTNLELDGKERLYRIYLPLQRRVVKFEVGTREPLLPVSPSTEKPIAYYGTSIVHGAGVNRSGMAHAAQMGRRLDHAVLNLGFCGRAWLEPAVAEALGRLDPVCYILDPLPNNSADDLRERLPKFLSILKSAKPDTPVLLLGERVFGDAAFSPERQATFMEKNAALKAIHEQACSDGLTELHVHFEPSWYGDDYEGTTDASHPNDLGAWRMAQYLTPVVRKLLEG